MIRNAIAPLVPALLLTTLIVGPALAANEPRQHDTGFFLRLSGGIGGANASIDDAGSGDNQDIDLNGTSGDANFAIGAIVAKNLAIHGTFAGWSVNEPDVEVNGDDAGDLDDTTLNSSMFGAGVTYWFMPVNIYLSGSVCAATMELDVDGDDADFSVESDTGLGIDLTLGKEWWVSNKWGLGVAAGLQLSSVSTEDEDDLKGTSFAIRFSATYN